MKVCAIVPVAPFEPRALIEKSIESLRSLHCNGLDFEAYYVIDDGERKKCEALQEVLPPHFYIVSREHSRGRRAGAINDILNIIEKADYVALFDVDSRPQKNFLIGCVRKLESVHHGVLASGCRFVTNKESTLTKIISVEYGFFCHIYRLAEWSGGFTQFNGLIGVSRAEFLRSIRFNECCSCEDLDVTEQIYLSGKRALLVDTTKVGEQAPTSLQDLFEQRVRWFRGALEGLQRYLVPMLTANVPAIVKVTWLGSLTIPFFAFLLAPFAPLYSRAIKAESGTFSESMKILFGLMGYSSFMTFCGAVAVGQYLISRKPQWTAANRSEV
jgi:cellulose synthase/poly-beta-1,6-N-acetylglucosamine synthase-like glycosyltransferase